MAQIQYMQSQMKGTRPKTASSSKPIQIGTVEHTFLNDLESLFYVFIWVCIMFKGPASAACRLDDTADCPVGRVTPWLPHKWNGSPLDAHACTHKKFFFVQHSTGKARLRKQFAPYFQGLVPRGMNLLNEGKQPHTSMISLPCKTSTSTTWWTMKGTLASYLIESSYRSR
jgi:hypothetical protein